MCLRLLSLGRSKDLSLPGANFLRQNITVRNANEMSAKEREMFIRSMVERLANRLQSEPNDLRGWQRLARAYRVLGETKKAEVAEKRIKELEK